MRAAASTHAVCVRGNNDLCADAATAANYDDVFF